MLAEARADLAALLESAGLRAFAYTPDRAAPPMAVVFPGAGEWINSGSTFGTWTITFDVYITARTGSNVVITADIDEFVEAVLQAVNDTPGFEVASVGAPTAENVDGTNLLVAVATIRQYKQL